MGQQKIQILDNEQVARIITRMAHEVYERNFNLKSMVLAGVEGRGLVVANQIKQELASISKMSLQLVEIKINKDEPTASGIEMKSDGKLKATDSVLLVDDVLNSGRTLIYSMQPFLNAGVRSVQVAVLVDRNHKRFPVAADYIGLSLQTTLQEHVHVTVRAGKINAFLE